MKRIVILFILSCCVHIINAQAIDRELAWEIVQDSVIKDKKNIEVYVAKAILPAKSIIRTIYGTEMAPTFDSWFFF